MNKGEKEDRGRGWEWGEPGGSGTGRGRWGGEEEGYRKRTKS
jgi:hypothetical protein